MVRHFRHIAAIAAVLALFLSSCGGDRVKVIPRDELAHIYAEMMMTDQWILNTPDVRLIADTSLVYEPILEKYGYDSDDYRKSVDEYMDDPERFAKILRETGDILELRLKELEVRKEEMERVKELRKAAAKFRPNKDFDKEFPYLRNEPYVHYHDSLSIEMDSLRIYRMTSVETADTLYEGVRMVIPAERDTVSVILQEPSGEPEDIQSVDPVAEPSVVQIAEPERKEIPASRPKTIRNMNAAGNGQLQKGEKIERIDLNQISDDR